MTLPERIPFWADSGKRTSGFRKAGGSKLILLDAWSEAKCLLYNRKLVKAFGGR